MQSYPMPPGAALLPGAMPYGQHMSSGPLSPQAGASAAPGQKGFNHSLARSGGSASPSFSSSPTFAPQGHFQLQHGARPSMGQHQQSSFVPGGRPHVPFMHPLPELSQSHSSPNNLKPDAPYYHRPPLRQLQSVNGPGGRSYQQQPRYNHGPRPSLSVSLPNASSYASPGLLTPKPVSPAQDTKSTNPNAAYSPLGMPLRRQYRVQMPVCKLWTREALSEDDAAQVQHFAQTLEIDSDSNNTREDVATRTQHEDEVKQHTLPPAIDVYLPGAMAWIELLEQLIHDRPLGSPVPPDLLAFKLNNLNNLRSSGPSPSQHLHRPSMAHHHLSPMQEGFQPAGGVNSAYSSLTPQSFSPLPPPQSLSPVPPQQQQQPQPPPQTQNSTQPAGAPSMSLSASAPASSAPASTLAPEAPSFKPKLNPAAPVFSFTPLKPTAAEFKPIKEPEPLPQPNEEEPEDAHEESHSTADDFSYEGVKQQQDFGQSDTNRGEHQRLSSQSDASESSLTNPSEEGGEENEEEEDDEPLASLAARRNKSLQDPLLMVHSPSIHSQASYSSSARSYDRSVAPDAEDHERSGSSSLDEDGFGHSRHSSRASEAIRRAVEAQGRRLSDAPPDPDPWLDGAEEIGDVRPSMVRSRSSTMPRDSVGQLSVDAKEFTPANPPMGSLDLSQTNLEQTQWFDTTQASRPSSSDSRSSQEEGNMSRIVQEEQPGKDSMRTFKFPPPLEETKSPKKQAAPPASAEEEPTRYRGHSVQPSGLAKSLAADPHGTAFLPRNSPEVRHVSEAGRVGPLPSLFEGEAPYHERIMSLGDEAAFGPNTGSSDQRQGKAASLLAQQLTQQEQSGQATRQRSDTQSSYETDPSMDVDHSPLNSSWRVLEGLLEGKLNELRQDLTGFGSLKADLDALKRDALVDAFLEQLDRKLAEWTAHVGLTRASLDDPSLCQIQHMLENSNRRTLDHVLSSINTPQLEATISESDKDGLVNAIVAASNSSTFSPLVNLQAIVQQLSTAHQNAADQIQQLQTIAASKSAAQDSLDVASLAGVILEEAKASQLEQLASQLSPLQSIQEDIRELSERASVSFDAERLPNLVSEAIQSILPSALTSHRESTESALKEILSAVLAAVASSEQDMKTTRTSMDRFNDQVAVSMRDLRDLVYIKGEVSKAEDLTRIAELEAANSGLREELEQALTDPAKTQVQQAQDEAAALRVEVNRLKMQASHDERCFAVLLQDKEASEAKIRDEVAQQNGVLQSRLEAQDDRIAQQARELGHSKGLSERLQEALEAGKKSQDKLADTEAAFTDYKIRSVKENAEASARLEAIQHRIFQLEEQQQQTRIEQAGELYKLSHSRKPSSVVPRSQSSYPHEDVVYGDEEDEDIEVVIATQGTATSRHNLKPANGLCDSASSSESVAPSVTLRVPKPADDGWWS